MYSGFWVLPKSYGAIWCVSPTGSDQNNGSSWDQAFAGIQKAVSAAADGDEIWVAKGTYILSQTIYIQKNISLYGGFVGNETSRDQRDWKQNETIVDGNSSVGVFSIHGCSAILDGFTITHGFSSTGGGISISYTDDAIIRHCKIIYNTAEEGGGGIFVLSATADIVDSLIYENHSLGRGGGGIYAESGGVTLKIINCVIWKNTAVDYGSPGSSSKKAVLIGLGGGIYFSRP